MNTSIATQTTEITSRLQQVFDKQRTASRQETDFDLEARLKSLDKLEKMERERKEHSDAADACFEAAGGAVNIQQILGGYEELPGAVRRAGLGAPAVIVVGEVVQLRSELAWAEGRPLFGRPRASRRRCSRSTTCGC